MVKSDKDASTADVTSSVTIELHDVAGSTIVSKESPGDAAAANAMIEKSVWQMQHIVRFIDTYVEWVHRIASGFSVAILTLEIVERVVSRRCFKRVDSV